MKMKIYSTPEIKVTVFEDEEVFAASVTESETISSELVSQGDNDTEIL